MTERQKQLQAFEKLTKTATQTNSADSRDYRAICKEASEKLSEAAEKLADYKKRDQEKTAMIKSLQRKNAELSNKLEMIQKTTGVKEIVTQMIDKGMLRQSEAEEKTAELLQMNSDALIQFKTAVDGVQRPNFEKLGADNLSFLLPDTSEDLTQDKDMLTSFSNMNY